MSKKTIIRGDVRIEYQTNDPGLHYLAELMGVDDATAAAFVAGREKKRRGRDESMPTE